MDLNIDKIFGDLDNKIRHNSMIGSMERSTMQHLGHFMNHQLPEQGSLYNEMFAKVERFMKGQKQHGFEQNKKTEEDKLIEKGEELNGTRT